MPTTTTTSVRSRVFVREVNSMDLGEAEADHLIEWNLDYTNGTGEAQCDEVWSDTRSVVSGTPDDVDVKGALTQAFGGTFDAVEIVGVVIKNNATTAGQYLTVGNDGSAAVYSKLFGASGHTIAVQAGGKLEWWARYDGDGIAVTASTADILQVAASSGTVEYEILLAARSA